jgi:hypothetical protein
VTLVGVQRLGVTPPRSQLAAVAAALLAATAIAACGSSASSSAGHPTPSHAQQEALDFSRCMRSHGVSHFPDPAASGGFDLSVAGINSSSPAFLAAQTACRHLLPVKRVSSGPPTAQDFVRLVRLARCMRTKGYPGLPDPRPQPPPANPTFGTAFGIGGYYIGIPDYMKPHSAAFIHALEACHESP